MIEIDRSDGGGPFLPISPGSPDSTAQEGRTYSYRARFADYGPVLLGLSDWATSGSVKTPPKAPAYLVGEGVSGTEIDATWINGSEAAATTTVDLSADASFSNVAATVTLPVNTATYAFTGLTPGATYYLRARHNLADGTGSAYLTATSQTMALPVVSIAAVEPSATEVGPDGKPQLDWFVVTRTGLADTSLTISLSYGGDAIPGNDGQTPPADYKTLPTSVTFAVGEMVEILAVVPTSDSIASVTRTVQATLAAPPANAGWALGAPQGAINLVPVNQPDVKTVTWEKYDPSLEPAGAPVNWTANPDLLRPIGATNTLGILPELKDFADSFGDARKLVFATATLQKPQANVPVYFEVFDYGRKFFDSSHGTGYASTMDIGTNYLGGRFTTTVVGNISGSKDTQEVFPFSMNGIYPGESLTVSDARTVLNPLPHTVGSTIAITVQSTTATSFEAVVPNNFTGTITISGALRGEPTVGIWDPNWVNPDHTRGANRGSQAIAFLQGTTDASGVARVRFTVTPQPGDDYRVLATTSPTEYLNWQQSVADGGPNMVVETLKSMTAGSLLKHTAWSKDILRVYRTLHVERDAMAAPPASEYLNNNKNAATLNDPDHDVKPDLGPNGLADPSIRILRTEIAKAYIIVKDDLGAWNARRTATWVHEIHQSLPGDNTPNPDRDQDGSGAIGRSVRDVLSGPDFWTVQIVSAFEGVDTLNENIEGWSPGPIYVFQQSLKETEAFAAAHGLHPVNLDILTGRVVYHEVLHRFPGLPGHLNPQSIYSPGDAGVMNYPLVLTGTDGTNGTNNNIALTYAQIDILRSAPAPMND